MKGKKMITDDNLAPFLVALAGLITAIAAWVKNWLDARSASHSSAVNGYDKLTTQLMAQVDALNLRVCSLETALVTTQQELAATRNERDEAQRRVIALERRVSELEAELAKFKRDG